MRIKFIFILVCGTVLSACNGQTGDLSSESDLVTATTSELKLTIQTGHTDKINHLDFSSDNSLLLSSSNDGSFRLWNTDGNELKQYRYFDKNTITEGPTPALRGYFFGDNQHFVTNCMMPDSYTCYIWNAKGDKEVGFNTDPIAEGMAVSGDGKYIATGNVIGQGQIRNRDGEFFEAIPVVGIHNLVFSADNTRLLVAVSGSALLLDFPSMKIIREFKTNGYANNMAISNDDMTCLIGHELFVNGGVVDLGSKITGGAFLSDNQLYVCASDGTVELLSANGRLIRKFSLKSPISTMDISSDNQMIALGYENGEIGLYNTDLNSIEGGKGHAAMVTDVAFLPNGKILFSTNTGMAKVWDLGTNHIVSVNHGAKINTIADSHDGFFATGGADNIIKFWDWNGALLESYNKHDGQRAFTQLWDLGVVSLDFSPDGKKMVSSSTGIRGIVWSVNQDQASPSAYFNDEGDYMRIVKYSSQGQALVSWWGGPTYLYQSNGHGISLPVSNIEDASFDDNGNLALASTHEGNSVLGIAHTGRIYLFSGDGGLLQQYDLTQPQSVVLSKDGKYMIAANNVGVIQVVNTQTKQVTQFTGHTDAVTNLDISPDGRFLLSAANDYSMKLWNTADWTLTATLVTSKGCDDDYVIVTSDNYYAATKSGAGSVLFHYDDQYLNFDQLDVQLNRPDVVLERLGFASPEFIASVKKVREKRLELMGYNANQIDPDLIHVPKVSITNKTSLPKITNDKSIELQIGAVSKQNLKYVQVYVNQVPVFEICGKQISGKSYNGTFQVDLNSGQNRIEVQVADELGSKSVKQTQSVYCNNENKEKVLYIAVIAVDNYKDASNLLEYAVKDANDLLNLFNRQNAVNRVKSFSLLNDDATETSIKALKSEFMKTSPDDEVVVFYSGHGMRDSKTKDLYLGLSETDMDNLEKTALSYDVLEKLFDGIPARNKLLLLDACNSGEVDKKAIEETQNRNIEHTEDAIAFRGANAAYQMQDSSFEQMKLMFNDFRATTGATVISSAGGVERAGENSDLQNGFFTHFLIQGMEQMDADFDHDGKIYLSELKRYIDKEVRDYTNGQQNPSSGVGDIVVDFPIVN